VVLVVRGGRRHVLISIRDFFRSARDRVTHAVWLRILSDTAGATTLKASWVTGPRTGDLFRRGWWGSGRAGNRERGAVGRAACRGRGAVVPSFDRSLVCSCSVQGEGWKGPALKPSSPGSLFRGGCELLACPLCGRCAAGRFQYVGRYLGHGESKFLIVSWTLPAAPSPRNTSTPLITTPRSSLRSTNKVGGEAVSARAPTLAP